MVSRLAIHLPVKAFCIFGALRGQIPGCRLDSFRKATPDIDNHQQPTPDQAVDGAGFKVDPGDTIVRFSLMRIDQAC